VPSQRIVACMIYFPSVVDILIPFRFSAQLEGFTPYLPHRRLGWMGAKRPRVWLITNLNGQLGPS